MFEQILIRFRGGPISSNKDEDDESDDNSSSDTATTPSASDGVVGRDTLQLPLPRSTVAYQLSPSPSLGRSPSPSASTYAASLSSASPSPSSPSSSTSLRSESPRRSLQRHLITPNQSSSSITISGAEMPKKRTTRKKKAAPTEQPAPRQGRATAPPPRREEGGGEGRGQKRKASEMAAAQQSAGPQVGEQPPPEKRVTRAAKKREEEEEVVVEGGLQTRSGRRLAVAEGEHITSSSSPSERASSLSKRKSPFLEPPEHPLKRPASRRSVRSVHVEDDRDTISGEGSDDNVGNVDDDDEDDDDDDDDEAEGNDHFDTDRQHVVIVGNVAGGEKGRQRRKPAARSGAKEKGADGGSGDHHRKMDDDATDTSKRKLHPLLRPGPDNVAFPWWHNDDWLAEESPAKKKRRLDAATEIIVISSDDEGEDDEPRKLRSATRGNQTVEKAAASLPKFSLAEKNPAIYKKVTMERFEYPDEIKNAAVARDRLTDRYYLDAHKIKCAQEKADHKKELEKEQKNFNRYKQLLEQLEDVDGNEWMEILGVEKPETLKEVANLLRKRDRLMDELKAARRRYPIYKAEREAIDKKEYDPTFAGWLRRNNKQPLNLPGRRIEQEYWDSYGGMNMDEDEDDDDDDQ
ncbi:hypothetical protein H072_5536 [Dactylellina haptotyla CBS 200.50]|uniref:Something about silencing protein 4 domain-containing protein n=1 Tax=Dactylellina haptotyla (strain CBS 200.50) TaxID=1284197 RepID=S8AHC8_DACHA|nr:hypothetical protein H072_5536 [Dactylellina haptotyla CBS 200.50]